MSIASEITRLQTAKANLKTAINNKGGSLTTETISSYATAINNLPSGDLTIEGQQIITGILTGTVDEFDTVYSKFISDGSNWDTVHNKLSDPADLPAGNGWAVSFSSDDTYLAVGHLTSPYLTVYKRNGDTFTKLSGITAPTGEVYRISFSSDDTYLAVAHKYSPYLTVYKRNGDTFTILGITAPIEVQYKIGYGVSFSSDDTYLAVTHNASPYLTVYKRSGDAFTKLTGITALTGAGWAVSFSSDDTYLAVTHGTSPYLTVYKRNGDTFTKLSGITAPALSDNGLSFSSDDTYLAVGQSTSPFLMVYKRSGDTFTQLSGIAALSGIGRSVSFSSDDTYLAVAHNASPYLTVYKTTLTNPGTLISPALNEVPSEYHDLGYALESGVEDDEIDMVSIFRTTA